jgi:hypothetical protein
MSLEEKIGQMMIMGFHGTTPSSDIKMLIQKYHIGGTVLFSRNITDPRQVARLIKRLQSIALASKRAYVKWVFVSFLACLDMLRARAYSPTVAALWLRVQTFLNRAKVHLRDSALARNLF